MRVAVAVLSAMAMAMASLACAAKTRTYEAIPIEKAPLLQLSFAVEVSTARYRGWGAPLQGDRVLTVNHLLQGGSSATWILGSRTGDLNLLIREEEHDLALLKATSGSFDSVYDVSSSWPQVGETLYWRTHLAEGQVSWTKGWYLGREGRFGLVYGWVHPGVSGSPVIRANGEVVGIMLGGNNWSCSSPWPSFMKMGADDRAECLFRMTKFPASGMFGGVVGRF